MTELDVPTDPARPAFLPRGHPVRWAWLAFSTIAVLAAGSIWTGAVGPYIDVWEDVSGDRGSGEVQLELRNARHLPVTITAVGESVPGSRLVSVELLGPGGSRRPFVATHLDHGEIIDVVLTYRPTSCEVPQPGAGSHRVTARTVFGWSRTSHVERGAMLVDRPGEPPHRYHDVAMARAEVRHRCPR